MRHTRLAMPWQLPPTWRWQLLEVQLPRHVAVTRAPHCSDPAARRLLRLSSHGGGGTTGIQHLANAAPTACVQSFSLCPAPVQHPNARLYTRHCLGLASLLPQCLYLHAFALSSACQFLLYMKSKIFPPACLPLLFSLSCGPLPLLVLCLQPCVTTAICSSHGAKRMCKASGLAHALHARLAMQRWRELGAARRRPLHPPACSLLPSRRVSLPSGVATGGNDVPGLQTRICEGEMLAPAS